MPKMSPVKLIDCARLLTCLALFLLAACSTHPPVKPSEGGRHPSESSRSAADHALRMVGKPYRYGGNTPAGFDCSGLVQYSYKQAGLRAPRSTTGLRYQSRPISPKDLRRGDLLFFNQEGKKLSHVGIYVGQNRFVHAPSRGKSVYVANLSDNYWAKHFAEARRLDAD